MVACGSMDAPTTISTNALPSSAVVSLSFVFDSFVIVSFVFVSFLFESYVPQAVNKATLKTNAVAIPVIFLDFLILIISFSSLIYHFRCYLTNTLNDLNY